MDDEEIASHHLTSPAQPSLFLLGFSFLHLTTHTYCLNKFHRNGDFSRKTPFFLFLVNTRSDQTIRPWAVSSYAMTSSNAFTLTRLGRNVAFDPFQVQLFARHKDMKCTMRYIHLERILYQKSDNDEWTVRAVKTVEEASELVKVGFEYVTEIEGFKLFRKRK